MKPQATILQEIIRLKRIRVEAAKLGFDYPGFVSRAQNCRKDAVPNRFHSSFKKTIGLNIIAEIKRATPSTGFLMEKANIAEIATTYEKSGATAISVLTEEDYFHGTIEDLITARNLTDIPILRKDFIFDEFQVYESALIGADAILLIVGMLDDDRLWDLYSKASDLGLDVLVGVHDMQEMAKATEIGAKLIAVNNRNLHSFDVSLDISRELIKYTPKDALTICESGLTREAELKEMKELGFDAFLVGEHFMISKNLESTIRTFAAGNA